MISRAILRRFCAASLLASGGFVAAIHAAPVDPGSVVEAAQQKDRAAVRTLLRQGADVNAAQGDGLTALHWAALANDVEMAQMLAYAGGNLKATTRLGGYTPLHLAARNGHAEVVEALLTAGADAKATTSTGATALMFASAAGSVRAVTALLSHGADVDATEKARGQTALMFAAAADRHEVITLLVKRGARVSATNAVVDLTKALSPEEEFVAQARQQGAGAPGHRPPSQVQEPEQAARAAATPAAAAPRTGFEGNAASAGRDGAGGTAGVDRQYRFGELVGAQGGLTPLLFAVRQGYVRSVDALLAAGADINQVSAGDHTSPLLMALINGHFDLATSLIGRGANPTLAADNGVTPLYAVLNVQWAPKALYPQPRAYTQQTLTHLDMLKVLLEKGADPNVRLRRKVWYSGYNFDLSGVDEIGATPFWRAAYAGDLDAMRLLVAHGADPNIWTIKPAGRPRTGDGGRENTVDVSGQPPVPVGGPAVSPLLAVSGVGYGEGFAANSHRYAPGGPMPAVRYLVEQLGADVNATDHEGNTPLHHAASRGDNEMIEYLVSKGAKATAVNREGQTTADMANGPVQRTQPFPETVALLMKLGSKNSNKCVSC